MAKKDIKLSTEELEKLQGLQKDYNQLKVQLGDTVLQQNDLLKKIELIREAFKNEEGPLMEKYGKNSTINLETGEVTEKPEETPELKITK
tara:strand:- start:9367 stop:9636 length:270 start_codon:yes stop_codon:yes gene_type:complete